MVGATRPDSAENAHGVTVWVNGPLKGEGEAENAITPGCVVVVGSNEGEVDQAGAKETDVLGWATDNTTDDDPAVDTWKDQRGDYSAGDQVVFGRNVGDRYMGPLVGLSGDTTYSKYDPLTTHADGYHPAAAGDPVVARYMGDADLEVTDGSEEYGLLEWNPIGVLEESE